jgi:CRISPR-associated protein Csm5
MQNQTIQYSISTLSPVHLGCDWEFLPYEYVIENGVLYYIPLERATEQLSSVDMTQLDNLSLQADKLGKRALGALQQFVYDKREQLIGISPLQTLVADGVEKVYQSKRNDKKSDFAELAVARTAFNPHSQLPYVPGSALKGSIRTALLNHFAQKQRDYPDKAYERATSASNSKRTVEHQLRSLNPQKQADWLGGKFNNELSRVLKVSDAAPMEQPLTKIQYSVNVKKRTDKDGSVKEAQQSPSIYLQSLVGMQHQAFSGQLTITAIHGGQLKGAKGNQLEPTEQLTLDTLVDACNSFYLPILKQELNRLSALGVVDAHWHKIMQALVNGSLSELLNQKSALLLRVGRHSGAESVTVDHWRKIKIMGKKGQDPTWEEQTKTLWLAGNQKAMTDLLPFGWVLIHINQQQDEPSRQLHRMLENGVQALQEEVDQMQAYLETRKGEARVKSEQLAREQAELAKKQADEQAAAEAEAQKLAAMSPEQKAIFVLRKRMKTGECKGMGAGCVLDQDLKSLATTASSNWDTADKAALRELAKEIGDYLNINTKKNAKYKALLKGLV